MGYGIIMALKVATGMIFLVMAQKQDLSPDEGTKTDYSWNHAQMITFYALWLASAYLFVRMLFKLKSIEIMFSTKDDPQKIIKAYNRHN